MISRFALLFAWVLSSGVAGGQTSPTTPPNEFQQLFGATKPHLDSTLFANGVEAGAFSPSRYQNLGEGLQAEQSVTNGIGIVGRVTGEQLFVHGNFSNPLQPGSTSCFQAQKAGLINSGGGILGGLLGGILPPGVTQAQRQALKACAQSRYNYARLQGGIDVQPLQGFSIVVLGGRDFGDSTAASIEGDLRGTFLAQTEHPLSVTASAVHDYENGVTSTEIDFRDTVISTQKYAFYAGAGGAIYGGGIIPPTQGQGGVILGLWIPGWSLGFDLQTGYGSAGEYTQLSIFKTFSFLE